MGVGILGSLESRAGKQRGGRVGHSPQHPRLCPPLSSAPMSSSHTSVWTVQLACPSSGHSSVVRLACTALTSLLEGEAASSRR